MLKWCVSLVYSDFGHWTLILTHPSNISQREQVVVLHRETLKWAYFSFKNQFKIPKKLKFLVYLQLDNANDNQLEYIKHKCEILSHAIYVFCILNQFHITIFVTSMCIKPIFWASTSTLVRSRVISNIYISCHELFIPKPLLFSSESVADLRLTGGNWQKWKRVFLTCPCHEIYRDEAVGLKNTWKITIFVKMWNLGQYRENLIFCQ